MESNYKRNREEDTTYKRIKQNYTETQFSTVREPIFIDIFNKSPEERQYLLNNVENALGYPIEYYNIYTREKQLRNLRGYQECFNITNIPLFIPCQDQQFSSKIQIKQVINHNCIKTNFIKEIDITLFKLSNNYANILKEKLGIHYESIDDFENEWYDNFKKEIINKFEEEINLKNRNLTINEKKEIKMHYGNIYSRNNMLIEFNKQNKNNLDNLTYIILVIKAVFNEYSQYICIAGGFALAYYTFKNYGYTTYFDDIDLFIHSCDEITANKILNLLSNLTNNELYISENAIISSFGDDTLTNGNEPIYKTIQIIRRLYKSPAEIIHGFDVDSSCILVNLDGEIWTTQRGAYSIKNGYNVVNFDRLSPSYEYRLSKYRERGFAIWIPQIEYLKSVILFDTNVLKNEGCDIIIKKLIHLPVNKRSDYDELRAYKIIKKNINNERDILRSGNNTKKAYKKYKNKYGELYNGEYINFKTLNPQEQIINTFHRTVLNDIINWYPKKHDNVIDILEIEKSDELIVINKEFEHNLVLAKNVIRKNLMKNSSERMKSTIRLFLSNINKMYPECYIIGNMPYMAVTGIKTKKMENILNIWHPSLFDKEDILRATYNIQKLRCYLSLYSKVIAYINSNDLNPNLSNKYLNFEKMGKFVFIPIKENLKKEIYNISEEESYNYFKQHTEKNIEKYRIENEYLFKNLETPQIYVPSGYKYYYDFNKNFRKYTESKIIFIKSNEFNEDFELDNSNELNVSYGASLIDINILSPTVNYDAHLKSLEITDRIPMYIYHMEQYVTTLTEYNKINLGIKNNDEILTYPIYENFIPKKYK